MRLAGLSSEAALSAGRFAAAVAAFFIEKGIAACVNREVDGKLAELGLLARKLPALEQRWLSDDGHSCTWSTNGASVLARRPFVHTRLLTSYWIAPPLAPIKGHVRKSRDQAAHKSVRNAAESPVPLPRTGRTVVSQEHGGHLEVSSSAEPQGQWYHATLLRIPLTTNSMKADSKFIRVCLCWDFRCCQRYESALLTPTVSGGARAEILHVSLSSNLSTTTRITSSHLQVFRGCELEPTARSARHVPFVRICV